MPIDTALFRNTLAQWASGVTVVTTTHDGQPYGMTASSFSSVSMTPPLILVCVAHRANLHQHILASGVFGVHILSDQQTDLGRLFAGQMPDITDRFAAVPHHLGQTGSPIFEHALAWMDCRVHQAVEAGDHTVFIGEILDAGANDGHPILYYNRRWGHFSE
ncbi:MAG: flavin reductase family protein [Anaerolineae bacterium]|nr:flavin reductase family protein [Anaerolineae bacterium]